MVNPYLHAVNGAQEGKGGGRGKKKRPCSLLCGVIDGLGLAASLRVQHHPLILLATDELQRVVEMLLAGLDRRGVLWVAGQVGVDELDEAVQILCRDLVDWK